MFSSDALGLSNKGWTWSSVVGLQQTLPADILLSANLMTGGRTWTLEGWDSSFNLIVLGVSKGFLDDKLKVNLQAVSNLNRGGLKIESFAHGKDYENRTAVIVPICQFGIGLTWNFGKQGFQVKKTRKSIVNDDVINSSNGQAPGGSTPVTGQSSGAGRVSM